MLARDRCQSPNALVQAWLKPAGLLLAAADMQRPQRWRQGTAWIKAPDGSVAEIVPARLRFEEFRHWVTSRASREVMSMLLDVLADRNLAALGSSERRADRSPLPRKVGGGAKQRAQEAVSQWECVKKVQSGLLVEAEIHIPWSPLEVLQASEHLQESRALLTRLNRRASLKERQLMKLLARGVETSDALSAAMGCRPETVRTHLFHLRKKAQGL